MTRSPEGSGLRLEVLVLVVVLLATSCGRVPESDADVTELSSALFRLEEPGADPEQWTPVTLPDAWREQRPDAGGFGWYRIDFEGPRQAAETWAVLLPSVNMNAEVFVNGTRVGACGRIEEPVAHCFNRPLFFTVPTPLLAEEENRIGVRLWAYPYSQASLGPVWVGPESALRPIHDERFAVQVGFARLATAVAWLTAFFILALWIGTRFDGVYGWFGLALLFWSVASLNYWVRDIPLPHWSWERMIHASLECFAVSLAVWSHRFVGVKRPRFDAALFAFGGVAVTAELLAPTSRFYVVAGAMHVGSFAAGVYATATVFLHHRRFSVWERGLYAAGGVAGLGFACHDLALQLGWIAPGGIHVFAYLVPVILFGFGASLVARFVASLDAAESLNRELERRVEQKGMQIEEHHRRLRELEQDRMIADERERIMREMHDGLGGQLVSALALAQSGHGSAEATAEALRTALANMRVVIDSLDPALGDLPALLGALRMRITPLLDRGALQLRWRVGELSDQTRLGSERSLHLMRILQEAIANVVRHAGASTLTVEAASERDATWIEVRDDGRGFDPAAPTSDRGRGLSNMQRRADAIGARLEISSGAGTCVRLTWSPAG